MRKKSFLLSGIILLVAQLSWATPPSEIKLDYDKAKKVLHIKITHVTNRTRIHYIRKIIVTKNTEHPKEIHFVAQPTPSTFTKDVSFIAKPKDVIHVKAICIEGGQAEESLTIE